MRFAGRLDGLLAVWVTVAFAVGCGDPEGSVLEVDAEFNPETAASVFRPINEANRAVAQIFSVGLDGRLEEFWLVITDGNSNDAGTVRITVQPVLVGDVIDDDPNNSLIDPIIVDTATLPVAVEHFTEFDIGDEPGRDVRDGEKYALVVEFVSRATNNDTAPIALVLGQTGDPFANGTGATGQLGVGFTNNTEDYFFRTFILTE